MSEPIKSRIDFEEAPLSPPVQDTIKPAQQFADDDSIQFERTEFTAEQDTDGEAEALLIQALKPGAACGVSWSLWPADCWGSAPSHN